MSAPRFHLPSLLEQFIGETGYTPVTGGELEFYLTPVPADEELPALFKAITVAALQQGVVIGGVEKEQGEGQFEIWLPYQYSASACPEAILKLRDIVTQEATKRNMIAALGAKPFLDRPGNGLHFHVLLKDANGGNPFHKTGSSGDETAALRHAIGGLLATMNEAMLIFAPSPEAYSRYQPFTDAPTTISWGGNNRTVAVRIPASTLHPAGRHLEHRVAAGDADPEQVMGAILAGIHYGLKHQSNPGEKIYGNAFDAQYSRPPYQLRPLPTYEEAVKYAATGEVLRQYCR